MTLRGPSPAALANPPSAVFRATLTAVCLVETFHAQTAARRLVYQSAALG
jgi:hypothetical protein